MKAANSKIVSPGALARILGRLRSKNKRIVFTNGCFDILHAGHIRYLKKARSLGDVLVVGLNSDSSARRIKGPSRPINRQEDRALLLSSLSLVDYVTIFTETTPAKAIRVIKPDVLVKGGDWRVGDIIGGDFVKGRGGEVVAVPFIEGYSTSALLDRMTGRR